MAGPDPAGLDVTTPKHRPHVRLHARRQGQLRRPNRDAAPEAHRDDCPSSPLGRPGEPGLPCAARWQALVTRNTASASFIDVGNRPCRPMGERARGGPAGGRRTPGSSTSTTTRWSCCHGPRALLVVGRNPDRRGRTCDRPRRDTRPSADRPRSSTSASPFRADVHERAAFRARPGRSVGGHLAVPGGHGAGQLPGPCRMARWRPAPDDPRGRALSARGSTASRRRPLALRSLESVRPPVSDGFELAGAGPGLGLRMAPRPVRGGRGASVRTLRGGVARTGRLTCGAQPAAAPTAGGTVGVGAGGVRVAWWPPPGLQNR